MAKTYFTADPHFGQKNIIRLAGRPFRSIEEHDAELVARWNARVARNDTVYVVGDFAYRGKGVAPAVFAKLNGHKHLVIGNHDKKETLVLPWASRPEHRVFLNLDGEKLILDHYAGRTWNGSYHKSIQLYGHSHGKLPGLGSGTDIGVDRWNFEPVTLAEIKARLVTQPTYNPETEPADIIANEYQELLLASTPPRDLSGGGYEWTSDRVAAVIRDHVGTGDAMFDGLWKRLSVATGPEDAARIVSGASDWLKNLEARFAPAPESERRPR